MIQGRVSDVGCIPRYSHLLTFSRYMWGAGHGGMTNRAVRPSPMSCVTYSFIYQPRKVLQL